MSGGMGSSGIEEIMVAIALAILGIAMFAMSTIVPIILVLGLGVSVDAPSFWFFQMLPAVGLVCIAMSIMLFVFTMKKKK